MREIRPGSIIEFYSPSGIGRGGQEYSRRKGRIVMRSADDNGWVVNTGGRYGIPAVVPDVHVITKGKLTEETPGEKALGMGRGARFGFGGSYRKNPELMIVHTPNPYGRRRRRGSYKGGVLMARNKRRRRGGYRRRAGRKSGNPALYKFVGRKGRRRRVTLGDMIRANLAKMRRGKKGKLTSAQYAKARKKALKVFKKGIVYHQGMKMRIINIAGYGR